MRTLYYYYQLFYKNILKDNDPYFTARLALSASESFLVISLLAISSSYFFCWLLSKYFMISIIIIVLAINFLIVCNSEATKHVEKCKPTFFKSHKLSVALTWLFFLVTTSSLFWLGDVVQDVMRNCK